MQWSVNCNCNTHVTTAGWLNEEKRCFALISYFSWDISNWCFITRFLDVLVILYTKRTCGRDIVYRLSCNAWTGPTPFETLFEGMTLSCTKLRCWPFSCSTVSWDYCPSCKTGLKTRIWLVLCHWDLEVFETTCLKIRPHHNLWRWFCGVTF